MEATDDTPRDGYTSREVVELTGITTRQLDYWHHQGLIKPKTLSGRPSYSGERLIWTWGDVQYIRQIKARLDFGFSFDAAFRVADPSTVPPPADPRLRGADVEEAQEILTSERVPQEEVAWTR
jgi:DNA-binding transcriptional MerR regulator